MLSLIIKTKRLCLIQINILKAEKGYDCCVWTQDGGGKQQDQEEHLTLKGQSLAIGTNVHKLAMNIIRLEIRRRALTIWDSGISIW